MKMEACVTVRLRGGLGNQLFEYAAARALALRSGVGLRLDALSGFAYDKLYERQLKLDRFKICANLATPGESFMGRFGRVRRAGLRLADMARPLTMRRYITEDHAFGADALAALRVDRPVYLDGLWQSEDFFSDAAAAVRAELSVRDEILAGEGAFRTELDGKESVGVHVRRLFVPPGMSRPLPIEDDAPVPGLTKRAYYQAAFERLRSVVRRPHFYVFSDHPDWARSNLRFPGPVTFVSVGDANNRDVLDLYRMSLCRHHVIGASTFGWWGAWLSAHPEKLVFAPGHGWNHVRALPDAWQRVDVC